MLTLFKALVMSPVDYGSKLWSPYMTKYIDMIEKTQWSFTRYISGMQGLSYPERLTVLKLHSLQRKKYRDIVRQPKVIFRLNPDLIDIVFFSTDFDVRDIP